MAHIVACSGCGSQLRIREEYLGRALKCPKCGQTMQTGGDIPSVAPAPIREAPLPRSPVLLQPADEEIPAVLPKPRRRRPAYDDDTDRGRARLPGAFAPCPKCGNTDAERVLFTFWGSFHITNLVCHVQCPSCGTCYNGRSGRSNLPVAMVCVLVPLMLIVAIIGTLLWFIMKR